MSLDAASKARAALLRQQLAAASDEQLNGFLAGHACGTIAAHLIAQMTLPARHAFFAEMRELYAEARATGGGS